MKRAAVAVLALLAACDRAAPPIAPTADQNAIAAAERRAVSDTDAALAESRAPQATGTKGADALFPR